MNLDKLTPAPWYVVSDAHEVDVCSPTNGQVLRSRSFERFPDAEFAALARNAFDIMMRRKWWPILGKDGKWRPGQAIEVEHPWQLRDPWVREVCRGYDDPFTALTEAEKWYKENVDA